MTTAELQRICRSLPATTEQVQWETTRVFKIGGKMFACTGVEKDSRYSFKVDDHRFLELTDVPGIIPAPYLARAKWVQIDPAVCTLGKSDVEELVRHSYALVLARLPKKTRRLIAKN